MAMAEKWKKRKEAERTGFVRKQEEQNEQRQGEQRQNEQRQSGQRQNGQSQKHYTQKSIQQMFFRTQLILIVSLALFLGITGTLINIHFETEKRDRNLQNVAEAIAHSPILTENGLELEEEQMVLMEYLDSLKETLDDIDVISVVDTEQRRVYHSNHALIGTVYDGTLPVFVAEKKEYDTADETGPSGTQRRAYAAVYDEDGTYSGFVMAIMLMKNIRNEVVQTLLIYGLITIVAILMELMISAELSGMIKKSLMGYEPDVFTAMYKMRDNILESLDEGILGIDKNGTIQFANEAATAMLKRMEEGTEECSAAEHGEEENEKPVSSTERTITEVGGRLVGTDINRVCDGTILLRTLESGEKEFNGNLGDSDILIDSIPIKEEDAVVGAIGILHNRAEYTRLMEDLTGTRYLVDSMRANNHDFTNKLHVILGLIQMGMYEEATSYIQNITIVQRAAISRIMNAVSDPAVAALLIGKTARASELNVKFILREGCSYVPTDMNLPSEVLVTVIGNLIDNAFEAMNENSDYDAQKELMFGIYSRPGAVLITADDTGCGICEGDMEHIFKNGYSTKGQGRGTGLYQVKTMVEGLGGTIAVESQVGVGTSFSVSFTGGKEFRKGAAERCIRY